MTRSTSPRLYQLRSMITTSPWREGAVCIVAGTSVTARVRWGRAGRPHGTPAGCDALDDRLDSAALPGGVPALEHNKTFAAEAFTHACIATSSPCSRRNSRSCCFLFILACGSACAASAVAVWPSPSTSSRRLVFLATSTPFGETSTRHTVPEARSAARGDRGAANDPRQHLPEGQSMADPTLACFGIVWP